MKKNNIALFIMLSYAVVTHAVCDLEMYLGIDTGFASEKEIKECREKPEKTLAFKDTEGNKYLWRSGNFYQRVGGKGVLNLNTQNQDFIEENFNTQNFIIGESTVEILVPKQSLSRRPKWYESFDEYISLVHKVSYSPISGLIGQADSEKNEEDTGFRDVVGGILSAPAKAWNAITDNDDK